MVCIRGNFRSVWVSHPFQSLGVRVGAFSADICPESCSLSNAKKNVAYPEFRECNFCTVYRMLSIPLNTGELQEGTVSSF